ncbi:gephyrin [Monomorium pharaonis]|uniref:gephyrin n=1 Tax=Monomorium pharaonis TaxID=307658 RepID=UPI00063ED7D9|nr:gephyrin [Monomorium pharaonis]
MILIEPVKDIVMEILLLICTNNEADIIFITGDIETIERHNVNEAIENVISYNELHEIQKNFISRIETILGTITCDRIVCGIRNKALIINLSSSEDKVKLFAAIVDMLENTLRATRKRKYLIHAPSDSACSSNIASNEKIDKDLNESDKEPFPMISLEDALKILAEVTNTSIDTRNSELVKLSDAYGRVLNEDVVSNCNMPSFRISTKHGYAMLASDGQKLRKLLNKEKSLSPISLQSGTCVWVDSGASIPDEATSVVHVNDTQMLESLTTDDVYIYIMAKPRHMQNIKPIGYDIAKEQVVVKKFTCIGPDEMAILAASGCKEVSVIEELRIGVLSIGDNLEEPGEALKPGYVHDINRITLISLLRHNGFSSLDLGIVNDKFPSIFEKIEKALRKVDILVTTGSVNDNDLLKTILKKHYGAKIHFGNIDIKPGKSTALATCTIGCKTKYLLCFSGNPLSAFTAAQVFLLPFVNKMCGYKFSAAIAPVCVNTRCLNKSFISHNHRRRLAWTHLQRPGEEESPIASNMDCNLFKDKLCNIIGSNTLLLLPKASENCKLMTEGCDELSGFFIDN